MQYEVDKTSNYRFQYNKLPLKFKRFVDEAIEIIKESPKEFQGRITHIANKRDGGLYRYRIPGAYILYVVPADDMSLTITLTNIKTLY